MTSAEYVKPTCGQSTAKSFVNLFKPSLRDDSLGVVWAERLRNIAGITVIDSVRSSQLACNVCLRKIKNLCELLQFISEAFTTVFVDKRLSKTKHPRKRFENFRQSYMLLTDRIEIH